MLKLFAIAFLAGGVWLGVKAERFLMEDRCLDAGGTIDDRGICYGARPL
jgi:hypothetical protein